MHVTELRLYLPVSQNGMLVVKKCNRLFRVAGENAIDEKIRAASDIVQLIARYCMDERD